MNERPTNIRHWILAATTAAAFLMYVDRICMAEMMKHASFKTEIPLSPDEDGAVKASFFAAYAIGQLPAGYLAVKYGARGLMTAYILLWSAFTVLTGFAIGIGTLLFARIGCGLAEAGAYPISSGLLARWSEWKKRGFTSSVVSLGGRAGLAAAPPLTLAVLALTGNWRWAGWIFGVSGIFFAWFFWKTFRERPKDHPSINQAELDLLAEGRPPEEKAGDSQKSYTFPWRHAFTHRSLWMNCLAQVFTNIGWVFLAMWLSEYLTKTKGMGDTLAGNLTAIVLGFGIAGLIFGGFVSDLCVKRWGVRWGRIIPLAGSRFLAAGFYFAGLYLDNPMALVAAFGLVSFTTDFGLPSLWAGVQEMCGKHTPPLFGWANMWGNLGAAFGSYVLPGVIARWDTNGDWNEALIFCACAFIISGLFSLGFNAEDRLPDA